MSWKLPFPDNKITGHYGTMSAFRIRNKMQAHSGTDWAMREGTKIPAIGRGTVKLIQFSKVLGWVLVQSIMDKKGVVWYIGYCHLKDEPTLKVGARLAPGDSVGLVGNTGSASSGAHLHATLSRQVKGVFGPTSTKTDLHKAIKENA